VKTADTSGFSAGRQGSDIIIRVQDAGIGISAEKLPDLFRIFSQVDHTSSRSEGGLGIGLALVKQLIELHVGEVTATSPPMGNNRRARRIEFRLTSKMKASMAWTRRCQT
jgi:signal transduction histidine kinase